MKILNPHKRFERRREQKITHFLSPQPPPSNLCLFLRGVCVCARARFSQSCPTLATPQTVTCQAPPSMEFSMQEYWSGLPFPSPRDLPNPGIKPGSPALQAEPLMIELGSQRCVLFVLVTILNVQLDQLDQLLADRNHVLVFCVCI